MVVPVNVSGAVLAEHGGVMSGSRRPYFMPGYTGTLSVKSMVRGKGLWRTAEREFMVEPGRVLIMNHGQHYTLTIEGEQEMKTFCPFFSPSLVREAVRARTSSLVQMLDRPIDDSAPLPVFVERLRPPNPRLQRTLERLRSSLYGPESEARFFDVLDAVLDELDCDRKTMQRVGAARPSTREELFRRIHRAVDFAHAHIDAELSVSVLAKVAAMSPYHFHRTFSAVVGQTPARYVSGIRLLRARTLLQCSGRSVSEVCFAVGFASVGSFSSAFRRQFGLSPSSVRK